MESIVRIRIFEGNTKDRQLATVYSSVRCLIGSARNETVAFYENVPVGQLYEFSITDSRIDSIPSGTEIKVTNPQSSGLLKGGKFVVTGKTQRQRVGGRFFISGVCYIKE